jgi:hypothetical protein
MKNSKMTFALLKKKLLYDENKGNIYIEILLCYLSYLSFPILEK